MSADTPQNGSGHAHTNRLAREKSPYLLQHAHNPVDWYPWGAEALERAKAEDKPIFLSVGYSACHWCHVMERESFENEQTAAILNQYFVSVKVDREERPDVDEIYMTAVQMMTGHGGWPMSVFLMPDGRPFYGGTYFPPENRHGRVGFPSLLAQLADAYRNRRGEIEQVAASMTEELQKATRQRPLTAPDGPLDPAALLHGAVADLEERFDAGNGGFGGAPKFPPHHGLRLLLAAGAAEGEDVEAAESARRMLTLTLDRMALGGVYDHVGGGFHRYATDAVWLLPHFEKMLYDNALLAGVYADAYALTGRQAYARVARETCDWVLRDMTDPGGGFHAALDADSEGEEGKYYVWTVEEVEALLGESATEFRTAYHILNGGNFRDEATGQRTGANIPYLAVGPSDVALPDETPPSLADARATLMEKRYKRVRPGKDDKVITGWNGLMIGGLARAGKALSEPRYLEAARTAARFCLTTLRPGGQLLRRYARGEAGLPAYLDDHAYLADGLLDLAEATGGEGEWVEGARALADTLLDRFWDPEDGGFFFAGEGHEALVARSKDLFDGALPSANGVAARALARLGRMPGGERYAEKARALLLAYHGVLLRAPQGTTTLILAAGEAFAGADAPAEIVSLAAKTVEMTLMPGTSGELLFHLRVAPGWHVNARTPTESYLIPTRAAVTTDAPASVGPVRYPEAAAWTGGEGTLPLSVYEGESDFHVGVSVPGDAHPGAYEVTLTVRCQPCGETECLPPVERAATVKLIVG